MALKEVVSIDVLIISALLSVQSSAADPYSDLYQLYKDTFTGLHWPSFRPQGLPGENRPWQQDH